MFSHFSRTNEIQKWSEIIARKKISRNDFFFSLETSYYSPFYLFMQPPCVIFAGHYVFLPEFLLFVFFFKLEFKPKTNQKSKNHNNNHIVPNDNTIYSIQSEWKMCDFFKNKNPRNMKGARYKMFRICLGTNKKLFIPQIMKLRVKMRDKNSLKIK